MLIKILRNESLKLKEGRGEGRKKRTNEGKGDKPEQGIRFAALHWGNIEKDQKRNRQRGTEHCWTRS